MRPAGAGRGRRMRRPSAARMRAAGEPHMCGSRRVRTCADPGLAACGQATDAEFGGSR